MVPLSATSGDRFLGSTPGPGGTTYAVGFTTSPGSPDQSFVLAKLRSDGSRDAEFGTNGVASINLRPGPFAQPPANPDGTFPATPTGNQEVARGVVVQSDGKIVITGQAETPASPAPFDMRDVDVYAVRFNADGTLDTTYGGANSPDPAPAGVAPDQHDQRRRRREHARSPTTRGARSSTPTTPSSSRPRAARTSLPSRPRPTATWR